MAKRGQPRTGLRRDAQPPRRARPLLPGRRAVLAAVLGVVLAPRRGRAAAPRRVVSLDYALTETMLALGAAPLAMPDTQDWDRWVVEPPLPAAVSNLGSDQELNFELLAGLKPDLILTTPYLDAARPTLERIAPCERLAIYDPGVAGKLAPATEAMRRIADLIDAVPAAERYIAATEAQFRADAARLDGPVPPLLLVNFLDARHLRVYGAHSLWQDVLDRLGLPNAWRGATGYWGFSTVGIEALAETGAASLLAFAPIPADTLPTLAHSPLWRALPFVRRGAVLNLPPVLMFGGLPSARRFSRLLTAGLAGMRPHG